MGNEQELVEDIDPQSLIKLVKFLKRGKAPGPDIIHNEVLRLGTTTSLFHHLAKPFTSSIQLGYIPTLGGGEGVSESTDRRGVPFWLLNWYPKI